MSRPNLSRDQLATLVRELLLCGHLIDRATMPHVLARWGREAMRDVAIDEWMGASPIYTRRMQRLLGFVGDDVTTIFKGMQFDIGAPPQFMDFRYVVHDAKHGAFHLDHCGALMDVEPMGPEYVVTMCHDIEDPTFDATAWATNPRARMRPIHRPPREPENRHPHCAWSVTIDPTAPALPEPEMTALIASTRAASTPLAEVDSDTADDHASDYSGPLVDDIDFTGFSTGTLDALAEEVALQSHLLALAGLASITGRYGSGAAHEIGQHQLVGSAGLTAERIRDGLHLGSSLADLETLLDVHPLLRPSDYVTARTERAGDLLRLDIGDCPALSESVGPSWVSLLVEDTGAEVCTAIAHAIDSRADVRRIDASPGRSASFELRLDGAPTVRHRDVNLARISTGAAFAFSDEGTRVHLRARRGRRADPPIPGN